MTSIHTPTVTTPGTTHRDSPRMHRPQPGGEPSSPRWLIIAAWGAFLVTVPSGVWRVLMITGLIPGTAELRSFELGDDHALAHAYVFTLSLLQMGCGFLTVGLVRSWGERFLRRRVPLWPVVVLATLGGLTVTYLFDAAMLPAVLTGHRPDAGHAHGTALGVMIACYAPVLLWGPLELLATFGYTRRRLATGS